MQRKIEEALVKWKENEERKPLIILGARQVGKTYTIKEFGKKYYKNIIYIDFEAYPRNKEIFNNANSLEESIYILEDKFEVKISRDETLIIFDEIEFFPGIKDILSYFKKGHYHVIGICTPLNHRELNNDIEWLYMYPLNFMEFLMACDRNDLVDLIRESYKNNTPVNDLIHGLLFKYYYTYLEVGGMPEAIKTYLETKDMDKVRGIHAHVIHTYRGDMKSHNPKSEARKTELVYDSIPSQLARENKKFSYSLVRKYAQASTLKRAIHWLREAGITYECDRINQVKYPLKPYEDVSAFKLYYSDVGLYLSLIGISLEKTSLSLISDEIRGGISETYVMSELVKLGLNPYYWESQGAAEIDFIIQKDEMIIPIEVKSKDNNQSKSMKVYKEIYTPKLMVRVGTNNFGYTNQIKTIPLYAVWCLGE